MPDNVTTFVLPLTGISTKACAGRVALREYARVITRDFPEESQMLRKLCEDLTSKAWRDSERCIEKPKENPNDS